MIKLTSKDWVRMLIAFLLGVAVTLLVIQLTVGQLFQGALTGSLDVDSTIDTREDTALPPSMGRLSPGLRIDLKKDDAAGLPIGDDSIEREDTTDGIRE